MYCLIDFWGNSKWRDSNGELHREDGPAVEYVNGRKEWFKHGLLHRIDGPAIIASTDRYYWYLNNVHYDFDNWCHILNKSIEERVLLKLRYC